jgi:hypothetical protein
VLSVFSGYLVIVEIGNAGMDAFPERKQQK